MDTTTRRGFLGRLTAAAAAPAVAGAAAVAASSSTAWAIPPIPRRRPSRLKLSVAAYSYRGRLAAKPPQMNMFEFVDLAADLGFDAVEPTSYYFPADVDDAYLARFKQHVFRQGLDVSGTAIGNNFCFPPGEKRDQQLALTRLWVDRAAAIGAPVVRIFAGAVPKGASEEDAVEWAVEGIQASLPYAADRGVTLALENHGGITAAPAQILRLVEAVDAPNFGVNLDTGNFNGEDPYEELAQLAPYAVNVQVKTEIHRKGAAEKEEADLDRVVEILRRAMYSGYVVLEYEAAEDPYTAVPRYARRLRALL